MLFIRPETLDLIVGHVADILNTLEDENGKLVSVSDVETHRMEAAVRGLITSLTGENVLPSTNRVVSPLRGIAEARKNGSY